MDNQTILARFSQAREIMKRDMNGKLDEAKRDAIANGKLSYGEEGLPIQATSNQSVYSNTNQLPSNYRSPSASKLPKAILESFNSEPLDNDIQSGSILDELNKVTKGEIFKKVVPEQVQTTPSVQNTSVNNIDYSMIRMICEETMRKYINALKKSILTESQQNTPKESTLKAMKIGDKFSFIDSKGNIYEAKLTLKGNVNDKK